MPEAFGIVFVVDAELASHRFLNTLKCSAPVAVLAPDVRVRLRPVTPHAVA